MAKGNYEDRVLEDAVRSMRLTEEQRQALGNYIHRGNEPYNYEFQTIVQFIQDFLNGPWRHYING